MNKDYKKHILITILILLSMILAYYLLVYLFFQIPKENLWIKNCTIKKESIANMITERKIVFTGGSATLFGVRTKDIQEELNIPTVNLAVHAGLQLDYILYRTKKMLRRTDILILIPEYENFIDDGKLEITKVSFVLNCDKEYFSTLPLYQQFQYLRLIDFSKLYKSVKNQLSFENKEKEIGEGYTSETLNGNGDETYNVGNKKMARIIMGPVPIQKEKFVETHGLKVIKEFSPWCEKSGIILYVSFPNTLYLREYEKIEYRMYFKRLQTFLAENNISTLGTPYDYFFDRSLFYDTEYHLNREGAILRTRRLIQLIKNLNIVEAKSLKMN